MDLLSRRTENIVLWILTIGMLASAIICGIRLGDFWGSDGMGILAVWGMLFSSYHCIKRYGVKDFLVFFCLVFVIASVYENLSILTTFPFGRYYYTDDIGIKLLYVPVNINFAYFQMLYITWTLADAVIGKCDNRPAGIAVIIKPVVASIFMVIWDLLFDPFMSTISQRWIWLDGGFYFGVPVSNFYGWFLCVFTMALLFSLYLWRKNKNNPEQAEAIQYSRINWLQFVLFYFSWILCFIIMGLSADATEMVVAADGRAWYIRHILQTCGLVGLFTAGFVSVIILLQLRRVPQCAYVEQMD
ncbi:MAG TPA: hypothetical protein DD640_05690 [Clostridiales bacterium]|nr:hypothetical protein [Clostridiales bacterium]